MTRHYNHSGYAVLERLLEDRFNICCVVLKKDYSFQNSKLINPLWRLFYNILDVYYQSRGLKNLKSEEVLAKKSGVPISKVRSMKGKEFAEVLERFSPDIIVLGGGWHELIPQNVIRYPLFGIINTHPSLLPEFRGTSITRWQILCGVKKSGCTIHFVNEEFDRGQVLIQKKVKIDPNQTPQELFEKLGELAGSLMPLVLKNLMKGKKDVISFIDKNELNPSYFKYFSLWKWENIEFKIDWSKDLESIHFFIMSCAQELYWYLGPYLELDGVLYFVRRSKLVQREFVDLSKFDQSFMHNTLFEMNGHIYVYRKGESVVMEICQIQVYDKFFKFRRGKAASVYLAKFSGQNLENM